MKPSLRHSQPLAEGVAKLLYPHAEVVIHDLARDSIVAIYNPFSQREVGDSSYLHRIDFSESETIIGPYEKVNWDGRKLKCISILLQNGKGCPEGFLCINIDISHFLQFSGLLSQFLQYDSSLDESQEQLFKEDIYEKINVYVQRYCREHHVALHALTREQKQELVRLLETDGAFNSKNAAVYIGRVLSISRATVYNYLK